MAAESWRIALPAPLRTPFTRRRYYSPGQVHKIASDAHSAGFRHGQLSSEDQDILNAIESEISQLRIALTKGIDGPLQVRLVDVIATALRSIEFCEQQLARRNT